MSGLKECGLNINHSKYATMNLIIHSTKKCGYVHLNP